MKLPYTRGTPVRVTSAYGYRTDPITGAQGAWHGGLDLVGEGDKTIRAVVGGTVIQSRRVLDQTNRTSEWGNYVCVNGADGNVYYYCHLDSRSVSAGDIVSAGDEIGVEGSTGRVTGRHCHFEVRDKNGKQINAADVLGIPNEAGRTHTLQEEVQTMAKEWWEDALAWAQANGIIFGDENGELHLDEPCTRRQLVTFLYRLHELIAREAEIK